MKMKVASCQEVSGTSQRTGREYKFFKCFFFMPDGGYGWLTSNVMRKPGDEVACDIVTGRDGGLTLQIVG